MVAVLGAKIISDMPNATKGTLTYPVTAGTTIKGVRASLRADLQNSLYGETSAYSFSIYYERKLFATAPEKGQRVTWKGDDETTGTQYKIIGDGMDSMRLTHRLDLGDKYA